MNRPSNGPWFASGAKIMGPKNPPTKPMPPTTSAPLSVIAFEQGPSRAARPCVTRRLKSPPGRRTIL